VQIFHCTVLYCIDKEMNLASKVSEFLHKSYKQLPERKHCLLTFFHELSYTASHPVDGIKCRVLPVVTGSTAEFYIDPMLKCVGDIDIIYHYSCELAIPAGHQPPTQLPPDFDSRVKVFEIVDSHVQGYVYLRLIMIYIISKTKTGYKYAVEPYINRPNTVLSHELVFVNIAKSTGHQPV